MYIKKEKISSSLLELESKIKLVLPNHCSSREICLITLGFVRLILWYFSLSQFLQIFDIFFEP